LFERADGQGNDCFPLVAHSAVKSSHVPARLRIFVAMGGLPWSR
jgi:hypothetical protein